LEDYTKFKLKDKNELVSLMEGKNCLFILACNKCFKEFSASPEPECGELKELAESHGCQVAGYLSVDFLCNSHLTSKTLDKALSAQVNNIFVISCGLGVRTVADFTGIPVYAACDSVSFDGRRGTAYYGTARHGMALTKRLCEACGSCYLNLTGGICPVTDCSKSLLNGQCGGSKNGKCEADKDKDCAWEAIYQRLDGQDRAGIMRRQPAQLRDYSRVNFKFINNYVKEVREKRLTGFYGGLYPQERKGFSEHLRLVRFPAPRFAVIPLSQHAGARAKPLVKAGDHVKMGQKIGEADGFISGMVHSSVSGIVSGVEPRRHPNMGLDVLSVIIESDGKDEPHESAAPCQNRDDLSAEDIIALIREKGIVGMGGAGFPTDVKLKSSKPVDTVLLNGCECEPLLTADHRVMLEYTGDVVFGLKLLLKATGAEKGVIVVEDNKRDAIVLLEDETSGCAEIDIAAVRTKYPQGAEKMLIKRALGRSVPRGGLPLDVGVVVINVSTAKAVSDAIRKGMPLIERALTVSGEQVRNPGNFIVRVGTPVRDILEYCGVETDEVIKLGGPMMGRVTDDYDVPVIKGTNGIIAVRRPVSEPNPCIRCGRCVETCPMELLPLCYPQYAGTSDWAGMKEKHVLDCIECGCCDYICSSKIPITDAIKIGKGMVKCL